MQYVNLFNTVRYSLGDHGVVYSHGRAMKPYLLKGYLWLEFTVGGVRVRKAVHRLVGLNFVPNPENKPEINHKNGIKTDNRAENLEWVTGAENIEHAKKLGLIGKRRVVFTDEQLAMIADPRNRIPDLAEKFGVSTSSIYLRTKSEDRRYRSNSNASKAVVQLDLSGNEVARYEKMGDAAKAVGRKNSDSIKRCIDGKKESWRGFKWKFV